MAGPFSASGIAACRVLIASECAFRVLSFQQVSLVGTPARDWGFGGIVENYQERFKGSFSPGSPLGRPGSEGARGKETGVPPAAGRPDLTERRDRRSYGPTVKETGRTICSFSGPEPTSITISPVSARPGPEKRCWGDPAGISTAASAHLTGIDFCASGSRN